MSDVVSEVKRAKEASIPLSVLSTDVKDRALEAMAVPGCLSETDPQAPPWPRRTLNFSSCPLGSPTYNKV